MTIYEDTIPAFLASFRNLESWLDKAAAHADSKKFDADCFVTYRLAPDQYDLRRQVQAACDVAKYAAAKLTGTPPPSHPDTEETLAQLRARIATCRTYLESLKPEQFVGAEDRVCSHLWMGGKGMLGRDYVRQYVLPNFYFHTVTAYSILRHAGVDLGKMDFVGAISIA